ncbi:MAG: GatB/YqeY domain-containing protein [Anaerolineaceae bacterium]
MGLKQTFEEAMFDSMRKKDDLTRDTLRLVLTAIKQAEVDARKPLDDAGILSIIQKEVKIRKETLSELEGSGRTDLIEKAQSEIKVLERFLPAQLSDEELSSLALKVIQEVSANAPSDMGKVMKSLLSLVQGKASPDRISQIVRKLLSS